MNLTIDDITGLFSDNSKKRHAAIKNYWSLPHDEQQLIQELDAGLADQNPVGAVREPPVREPPGSATAQEGDGQ
jgi:hypothetical protein